jgi:hypothetical protein
LIPGRHFSREDLADVLWRQFQARPSLPIDHDVIGECQSTGCLGDVGVRVRLRVLGQLLRIAVLRREDDVGGRELIGGVSLHEAISTRLGAADLVIDRQGR